MAKYLVISNTNWMEGEPKTRILNIEAEYFLAADGCYNFYTKSETGTYILIASVQAHEVLAVVDEEYWDSDYFADLLTEDEEEDDEEEDDEDEDESVCTECVVKDILECELFQQGVADMVAALTSADKAATEPAPEPTKEEFPIEHWRKSIGIEDWWGFHTPEGFVNFVSKKSAEDGRNRHINGERWWVYKDLTGFTKVED